MAVVSGNLTLMSAGYFLSPEGQTSKAHQILQIKNKDSPLSAAELPPTDPRQEAGGREG